MSQDPAEADPRNTRSPTRRRSRAPLAPVWLTALLLAACTPGGDSDEDLLDELLDGSGGTTVAGANESNDGGSPTDDGAGSGGGSGDETPVAPPVDPPPAGPTIPDGDDGGSPFEDPPEFSSFDIHAALAAARAGWSVTSHGYAIAGEIVIPSGFHRVSSPLDLTNLSGLHLRGASANAVLWADFANPESVVLNMTGSYNCKITNLGISGRAGIGILLARRPTGESAHKHRFDSVRVEGNWYRAGVVNICSEVNVWNGAVIHNHLATPALKICNASPWADVVVGSATMQCESYFGCDFANYSDDPSAVAIDLDNNTPSILSDVLFAGGLVSMRNGSTAAAMRIFVLGQCQQITIREMRWEVDSARNSIFIQTPDTNLKTMNGLAIIGGSFYQKESLVYFPNGQFVFCNFDGLFTACRPTQDWGVAGIRPFLWSRHWHQSRVFMNAPISPPTPTDPWPANIIRYSSGGD